MWQCALCYLSRYFLTFIKVQIKVFSMVLVLIKVANEACIEVRI